jgi:CRISPR/Cas system-associated exonuclease Cas4 (RecB family)
MAELVYNNEHHALMKGFGVKEFGEALEKAMKREPEFKTKTSFAPSSLGYSGSCPRYWYYAFNGAMFEDDNDGPSISNMNQGTAAGERIAKMLDKAGLLVDDEIPVRQSDPPVFGYIDAMVRWKGEVIPAEVKTTKTETWQWRAKNNMVPGYQMLQLLIYMYLTNKVRGFFITENKNTNELYVLPVIMTDERKAYVEEVFEWMRKVRDNAFNGELPTRPFSKSSMQCKGCALKNTCWEGYKRGSVNGTDPNPGVVDLPPLEVPKTL